jgi:DTW domain-containing protein YfiP
VYSERRTSEVASAADGNPALPPGHFVSRKDNAAARCPRCRMLGGLCVCALIAPVETRTRLVLLIHRREARKPTNTGRLAAACLSNSQVIVRGHVASPTPAFTWDPATQPLLLFPHPDATPLAARPRSERPVTLIVPDGNWRQAAKVRARVPGLAEVPCVSIEPDRPTMYRLRHETRERGLATIEAIAQALGLLEGAHVREALEGVFRAMVERTLSSRGQKTTPTAR